MSTFSIKMVPFSHEANKKHRLHGFLTTSATGDQIFCVHTHCRGECGYPALFFRRFTDGKADLYAPRDEDGRAYHDYKCHGAMVARGPVWQRVWGNAWAGSRVYLEEPYQTDYVFKMWWQ